MNVSDKQYWALLKKKIKQLHIFNCDNYSDSFLLRRIGCRLRALEINSYSEYMGILEKNFDERSKLLKELTIHVTHFFRDAGLYEKIKENVIPLLMSIKGRESDSKIRIWCAGCSSGEEAYSIAMLLKEVMGSRINRFNISIIGTDIDKASIEKAKAGIYEEARLKETNTAYTKKYFDMSEDYYKIKDEIKELVEFKVGDILSTIGPKNIDLLLCRNTVIYFNKELKERLYVDFFNSLSENGYLVLGMTESLLGPASDMFMTVDNVHRIYQKNGI